MSKRRKKHGDDGHADESWLIPYADILTLLLALFIVLFAMSSIDAAKFQAMSQSFNQVFSGGTGVFDNPSVILKDNAQSLDEQENKQMEDSEEALAYKIDQAELKAIQEKVNAYIEEKNLTDKLETSLTDEGLLVSIRDNVLFESGVAEVRREDLQIAKEISELLVLDPPREIIISGHTDNVPISTAQFSSNWELSVMRAVNFMKVILGNEKLDPSLFSAKGFGEFKPRATNDTADGRAVNRRVEILILPRNTD